MKLTSFREIQIFEQTCSQFSLIAAANGSFAAVEENGVEIFKLRSTVTEPGFWNGSLKFSNWYIETPRELPTKRAGKIDTTVSQLSSKELAEIHMSQTLSIDENMQVCIRIVSIDWSPPGIVQIDSSLLVLLTNTGSVTVWTAENTWRQLFDISSLIFERTQLRNGNQLKILRKDCAALHSTAVKWSNTIEKNGKERFCRLAVAQNDGRIFVFKINSNGLYDEIVNIDSECLILKSTLKTINIIDWICIDEFKMIMCGNTEGLLEMNRLNDFSIDSQNLVWDEEDSMSINRIISVVKDDYICIILIKKTFLIAINVDMNGSVLNKAFANVGNINIVGICRMNTTYDEYLVGTYTGALFKVKIDTDISRNSIQVSPIESNVNLNCWALTGLFLSANDSFVLLCLIPCKSINKVRGKFVSKLIICFPSTTNCLHLLLDNEKRLLTGYSDCFERLTVEKMANSQLKSEWPLEIKESLSLYEIKLKLWLRTVSAKKIHGKVSLDEDLLLLILHHHAEDKLCQFLNKPNMDDNFELTTIRMCVYFLQNYNGKYKRRLPIELLKNVLEKCGDLLPTVSIACEWCEETIDFLFCSQKHPRQWCCVTLQNIESDECLRCQFCGHLARIELFSLAPKCTFCDSYFQKEFLTKRSLGFR